MIFLYGTLTKDDNRTTLGNGNARETERITFPLLDSMRSAFRKKRSMIAFFTLQTLNGS
jgi:hypothetical protein